MISGRLSLGVVDFFSDDIVSVSQEFLKYIGQEMSISVTEDG